MAFNPDALPEAENPEEEKFKPKAELKEKKDAGELAKWFQEEVEDFADKRSDYMMGYHFEDFIDNLSGYLKEQGVIPTDAVIDVKTNSHTKYNEFGEGITSGAVTFMGKEILEYSSHDDGYGGIINNWDIKNLQSAIESLLK